MSDLTISVNSEGVVVGIDTDLPETDVKELLEFDPERLLEYYPKHAAWQAYWEELSTYLLDRYENFKNVDYRKWWSHSRRYAKLVLATLGDKKPTNDSIEDMVISIYSSDTTGSQRLKYLEFAYKESVKSKGLFALDKEDFEEEMFKYLEKSYPLHFEEMEQGLLKLKKEYESVRIIAERMNSRSFHMQEVAKLVKPKPSNTELEYKDREKNYFRSLR